MKECGAGKGSARRPFDQEKWDAGWDHWHRCEEACNRPYFEVKAEIDKIVDDTNTQIEGDDEPITNTVDDVEL